MAWRRRERRPFSLRRRFVTPEGVDLRIELGTASARAVALIIDLTLIMLIMIALTLASLWLFVGAMGEVSAIIWLLGNFILRNGWFVLFEMSGRGATPGKRVMRLRVIARDGARLTGGAVLARNAMREIELFLPIYMVIASLAQQLADGWFNLAALIWVGIFLFFPLFNRDRLRVGDLVAGTWVVAARRGELGYDLAAGAAPGRRQFSSAALALYGEYELQTLEQVLRDANPDTVTLVAATIRSKAGLPYDGDDYDFLSDYYAALCARLEDRMLAGRRRADKHAA